jgi:hypothetical protein
MMCFSDSETGHGDDGQTQQGGGLRENENQIVFLLILELSALQKVMIDHAIKRCIC